MSVHHAGDLMQEGELQPGAHKREALLTVIKRKPGTNKQNPVSFLEDRYSSVQDKERYAFPCGRNSHPMTATNHAWQQLGR